MIGENDISVQRFTIASPHDPLPGEASSLVPNGAGKKTSRHFDEYSFKVKVKDQDVVKRFLSKFEGRIMQVSSS